MTSVDNKILFEELTAIVGRKNVITHQRQLNYYSTGFRFGSGACCAVVTPSSLLQLWRVLQACIEHDKIIIMQAAKTGLNGGSTPFGNDYDRDVIIISTLKLDSITLLNLSLIHI